MSKDKVSYKIGDISEKAIVQQGSHLNLTNYTINVQNVDDPKKIFDEVNKVRHVKKPIYFRGESKTFVGRQEEIIKIKDLLTKANAPISIIGEPGIGKSELAYKSIHSCEDIFDYIIPIYFETGLSFTNFLSSIIMGLNLDPSTIKINDPNTDINIVSDKLLENLADNKTLILADSYEVISSALNRDIHSEDRIIENARAINSFLEIIPLGMTKIILTSIRRFDNLDREQIIPIDGLSEDESVDLFVKLAKERLNEDTLEKSKQIIKEIAIKTGGHPLSIELLARSYKDEDRTPLKGMLDHLGLGIVQYRKEKHLMSLEACFEYSIKILTDDLRDFLPRLTIFTSPFSSDAVEFIFGHKEKLMLGEFYDMSLLRRIDLDEYGEINLGYRLFNFHPSIRNYLEKMISSEGIDLEGAYRERFSRYFCKMLYQVYHSYGKENHLSMLRRLSIVFKGENNDIIRSINLTNSLTLRAHILRLIGITLTFARLNWIGINFLKESLKIDTGLNNKVGLAKDYNALGNVYSNLGEFEQSRIHLEKALNIGESINYKTIMATAHINIGSYYHSVGNLDQTRFHDEKALAIFGEINYKEGLVTVYTNLGILLRDMGYIQEAIDSHKKAIEISAKIGSNLSMAEAYNNLGVDLRTAGENERNIKRLEEALNYHKKAIEINSEFKHKIAVAGNYNMTGLVYCRMIEIEKNTSKFDEAMRNINKALDIYTEFKDKLGMERCYNNIGLVWLTAGDIEKDVSKLEEAILFFKNALSIDKDLENKVGIERTLGNISSALGIIAIIENDNSKFEEAKEYKKKLLENG